MKALTVDFELIKHSMKDLCRETSDYYLDRNTGKVFALSRNLIRSLVEDAREQTELPQWDAPLIPLAREIILMGSSSYVRVPEAFGCPEHRWMADFSRNLRNFKLRDKLLSTLRGRGACRRFKEILKAYPLEARDWAFYSALKWEGLIQKWLEHLSILAINQNPKKMRQAA